MIDPSKDKLAYFKDNIQTAEDKEEFDVSQYYYQRDDFSQKGLSEGMSSTASDNSSPNGLGGLALASAFQSLSGMGISDGIAPHGIFTGFNGSGMMSSSGPNSFLGTGAGRSMISPPVSQELHRIGSSEQMNPTLKPRGFPLPLETTKAPDMSEFPALGSRLSAMSLEASLDPATDARARTSPSEFVIQKEDFPALSPFPGPSSNEKNSMQAGELKRHTSFSASVNDGIAPSLAMTTNSSIGSRTGGVSSTPLTGTSSMNYAGAGLGHVNARTGSSSNEGELDPNNKYGLLGMLHSVIRPGRDTKKNLVMGFDLTSLGLNLNSSEPLHPTFASPWAENPLTEEPQYALPTCYYNQPPALKTTHLSKFHLETLFYIFYSMPKDVLQAYAAQELYTREWRYHAEIKIWLKRVTTADQALLASSSSSGSSVGSIGSSLGSAGPQFLYFDASTWERRVFTGNIHSVNTGLMSEEDIRVKFNTAT